MSKRTHDGDTTFTRRKFTLPEKLDSTLVTLAEDHYQGNVSLCLRAAIEDHQATLNGTKDEIVLQQVTRKLDNLMEQQVGIQATVADLSSGKDTSTGHDDPTRLAAPDAMTDEMTRVYAALVDTSDPLRLADLSEELDIAAVHLEPVLGHMVDLGFVDVHGTNPQRFSLTGTHTEDSK